MCGISLLFYLCRVDNSLTEDDLDFMALHISDLQLGLQTRSFKEELLLIRAVQNKILDIAPKHRPIALKQSREPLDLARAGYGYCYDRSRSMEKSLNYLGFETRHVSLFARYPGILGGIKALLTSGGSASSHAVTEVWTQQGWLIVDSNDRWLSLDRDEKPVSIKLLQGWRQQGVRIEWLDPALAGIYQNEFIFVYGLYSRHGGFFPPYNVIPDLNYAELAEHFLP
jgi:hypothetical protein